MNAVLQLRVDPLTPRGVSPADRVPVPAIPADANAMVELRRFLFEEDRSDGNYLICVILCNVIELLSKRSLLYEQLGAMSGMKALWGGDLVGGLFNSSIREGNCLLIIQLKLIGMELAIRRGLFGMAAVNQLTAGDANC
ncbi:hypothetical protein [Burkholderia sp. BE17]|uniref:hypothetical protein n=1 Tax=Burkholderia sp. BE17 TaxID=2656644 RepID=UPI00128DD7B9|nr:hypothetical protein [Burkholderia sp. BE17]MPV64829.1 hypothetical protein [Burkholderia sp. BE17]